MTMRATGDIQGMATEIRTTHTGSLPRPERLLQLLHEQETHSRMDELDYQFETANREAVFDVVRRQTELGIDLVNDGEMSKMTYATYIKDRLDGFNGPLAQQNVFGADLLDFPAFMDRAREGQTRMRVDRPACDGPISYRSTDQVERDLANLRDALAAVGKQPADAFVTAASPGVVQLFFLNTYYGSSEAYLGAIADAMRIEYETIVAAGFNLQIDCPDLAGGINYVTAPGFVPVELTEFRRHVALCIDALNSAVANIPAGQMRLHICWGNYEGPHHRDLPISAVLDLVLAAKPLGLSFEAANPRHAHEWVTFQETAIPDDKVLIPGMIDSCTNYIEHPELIAQRLVQFANIVGADRVIGGTDCGLSSVAGVSRVDEEIAWAKLGSLVEGAQLARDTIRRRSAGTSVQSNV